MLWSLIRPRNTPCRRFWILMQVSLKLRLSYPRLTASSSQDFYIVPAPNPDGYDFTWESDRFWYKNRQVMGPNAKCVGLDMNRCVVYLFFRRTRLTSSKELGMPDLIFSRTFSHTFTLRVTNGNPMQSTSRNPKHLSTLARIGSPAIGRSKLQK